MLMRCCRVNSDLEFDGKHLPYVKTVATYFRASLAPTVRNRNILVIDKGSLS
jgi:hypothetical protein